MKLRLGIVVLWILSVLFTGFALILAIFLVYKLYVEHKIIHIAWVIIFTVILWFSGVFLATVISATREKSVAKERFAYYQLVTFLILVLSLLAFAFHHIEGSKSQLEGNSDISQTRRTDESDSHQPSGADSAETNVEDKRTALGANDNSSNTKKGVPATQLDDILDVPRNVAEMSAIMVLFLLAELAAFIARDVAETKTALDTTRDHTTKAAGEIKTSVNDLRKGADSINKLSLVASLASLDSTVYKDALNLLNAWARRVPAPVVSNNQGNNGSDFDSVTRLCWRTLLKSYLKEEYRDFEVTEEYDPRTSGEIPTAVMPIDQDDIKSLDYTEKPLAVGIKKTAPEDYSFIATTVGFYAGLLAALVHDLTDESQKLSIRTGSPKRLCMAIATNMLPAHCWDWPMPDSSWCKYQPIKDYRKNMISAVKKGAQIDRVILVYDDPAVPFLFEPKDIITAETTNTVSFFQMLQSEEPLSNHVLENLSTEVREVLLKPATDTIVSNEFLAAVARDLNTLLEAGPLYGDERFREHALSDEIKHPSADPLNNRDMIRLNRLILEKAYPNGIVRSLEKPSFYAAHEAHGGYFWRRTLLDYMLDKWYILVPPTADVPELPGGQDWGALGIAALPLLPFPIQCAAKNHNREVHPIIVTPGTQASFIDKAQNEWRAEQLINQYNDLHGEIGHCWRLPLREESLNVLNGRHDVMFIGIGSGNDKSEGLWDDESCDWGICLMSSMNPITQTMLLTVISGEGVRHNYKWFRARLKTKVGWTTDRIKPQPSTKQRPH